MGSADVHLRTGRPGRALHREACPPRWGARCPPHAVQGRGGTQGQTADLTVTPVQTPARSAAAAWTGERPANPSPRVRRSATAQGPAGAGERGPERRAERIWLPAAAARGQISRGRSSPTRPWTARAGIPAPRWSCLLPAGTWGLQTE